MGYGYFQISMVFLGTVSVFIVFLMYIIFFLWVTERYRTSSGKLGTSVRYQRVGCSASGHLENICTDRRSQKFLLMDEFLPQTLWHLRSSAPHPPLSTTNTTTLLLSVW